MRTLQFQSPSLQIEQPQNRRIILNKNFFFQSSLFWASVIRTGFKSHAMTGTWCWAVWPGLCTFWASAFHQISHHVLCRITNTVLSIHICCGQQRKKKKRGNSLQPYSTPPNLYTDDNSPNGAKEDNPGSQASCIVFWRRGKICPCQVVGAWHHPATFFSSARRTHRPAHGHQGKLFFKPWWNGAASKTRAHFFGRRRILWHMLFLYLCTLVLRSTEVMGPAHRAVSCWCCRWLVLCTPAALQLLDKPDISLWLFGSAAVCIQVASSLSQTEVYIQFNLLLNTLKLYAKNKHLHLQFFASFGGPISKIERGTGKEFSLF